MSAKHGNYTTEQVEFSHDIQNLAEKMEELVRSLGTIDGQSPIGFSFTVLTQDEETMETTALAHAWLGAPLDPEENSKAEIMADAFSLSCAHTHALDRAVAEAVAEAYEADQPLKVLC